MYKFYEVWCGNIKYDTFSIMINRFDAVHVPIEVVEKWINEYLQKQYNKDDLRVTLKIVYSTVY